MTDTTECPKCFSEGAYFNGLNYECPDCGFEWNDLNDLDEENYLDDSELLIKHFEQIDKYKVGDKINSKTLRDIYSPSWMFEKSSALCAEEGVEEEFIDNILTTLIKTRDYTKILKIQPRKELPQEKIDKIIERSVYIFLANRDELQLYPTVLEWSQYINAPDDLIEKILSNNKPHIISQMPNTEEGDFTILFSKKIESLYKELKYNRDFTQYGRFTLKEMEGIFTNLANGDRFENYSENCLLEDEIAKYFSLELKVIRKYRKDLDKWREGTLDNFMAEARNKRLSKIDTIIFILEFYFAEIMN